MAMHFTQQTTSLDLQGLKEEQGLPAGVAHSDGAGQWRASKQRTGTQTDGWCCPSSASEALSWPRRSPPSQMEVSPLASTVKTLAGKMVPTLHHGPLESMHTQPGSSSNCPAPHRM